MVDFLMSNIALNINNEWKSILAKPETSKVAGLVKMLFSGVEGYVWLSRQGKQWVQKAYQAQTLRNPVLMANILGSKCYDRNNMYLSTCVYHSNEHKRESDIAAFTCVVVDVDYTKGVYGKYDSKTAANMLCQAMSDNDIPLPTYVETGRNFKLVYVFDKPFILHKNKMASRGFIKRLGQALINKINAIDDGWAIDDFKLHPFVRVPGSLNKKWTDIGKTEHTFVVDEIYEVDIIDPLGMGYNKHNIDALADTILPELPDWYDVWKAKKKAQKKAEKADEKITPIRHYMSAESLTESRERDFKGYQAWLGNEDIGHREQTLWMYWVNCLHKGMSWEEAMEQTVEFNHGFAHPLKDSTVRSECKPTYTGNMRDEVIREHLCIDESAGFFTGTHISKEEKAEYDKKRYNKKQKDKKGYSSKQEEIAARKEIIKDLLSKGIKDKEIYESLGISKKTYFRYKADMVANKVIHTSEKEENDEKVIHISGCQNVHSKCIGFAGDQATPEVVPPTHTPALLSDSIEAVHTRLRPLSLHQALCEVEDILDEVGIQILSHFSYQGGKVICTTILTNERGEQMRLVNVGANEMQAYLGLLENTFYKKYGSGGVG